MNKTEWTRLLIKQLASGHSNVVKCNEARDWLAGKDPPIQWEPRAKEDR